MKPLPYVCLLVCLSALNACTSPGRDSILSPRQNPAINQLETDLSAARDKRVANLAPRSFAKAQAFVSKARSALENNDPAEDVDAYVDKARNHLETAIHTASVVRPLLDNAGEARQKARDAGAESLGNPFESAEEDYLELAQAVRDQNFDYVRKHGPEVTKSFQDLEITIIRDKAMDRVRMLLDKARESGTEKLAPETYVIAEQSVKKAEEEIGLHPHDDQLILNQTEQAAFQVRRLMAVTESARAFDQSTPEQSALRMEAILGEIGRSLPSNDNRDKSVKDHVGALVQSAKNLTRDAKNMAEENDRCLARENDLKKNLKAILERQEDVINRRLAQRESLNMLEKMQGVFSPKEAEISRRGDRITIRLRELSFPEGEATLSKRDFGVLDKVQNVIQGFNNPLVTIEGYAGDTGSSEMDELISQMRAVAVKAYLLGKQALPPDQIQAVGKARSASLDSQGINVMIRPILSGEE